MMQLGVYGGIKGQNYWLEGATNETLPRVGGVVGSRTPFNGWLMTCMYVHFIFLFGFNFKYRVNTNYCCSCGIASTSVTVYKL